MPSGSISHNGQTANSNTPTNTHSTSDPHIHQLYQSYKLTVGTQAQVGNRTVNITAVCVPEEEVACPMTVVGATVDNPTGGFLKLNDTDQNLKSCMNPKDFPSKNCEVVAQGLAFVGPEMQVPVGQTAAFWKFTGEECGEPGGSEGLEANAPSPETPQCQTVDGKQVCNSPSKPKCITVGGEEVCHTDAGGVCAEGECLTATPTSESPITDKIDFSDGARVTRSSAPRPPKPNTGTAGPEGQTAAADGSFKTNGVGVGGGGSGTTRTYNYYSPSTMGNSADEGDGDGECDPETEECEGEGECDPETEQCEEAPPCNPDEPGKVCIDESGTPTDPGEYLDGSPLEEAMDGFGDQLDPYKTIEGIALPSASLWSTSSCSSMTINWLHGKTSQFPGTEVCNKIDFIRNLVGVLLLMVVAFALGRRVMREL